ncbi:MAG TPA: TPM domain-containing protein, partial [Terriglobales bacterium]|nr:TPM domain-containing protein [Terriglobales bacterium]
MVPPAPTARVNDYANALSAEDRTRLERVLAEGEQRTGAQVVVALFASLDGESLEDFSIRLAERWRVGRKDLDDGAIVLAFIQDRKLRIEVGYGLEGAIPDIEAARIIREAIAPRFREGRYAAGLEAAARAIYATVDAKPAAERRGTKRGGGFASWKLLAFLGIVAIVALMLVREAATSRGLTRRGYTAGRRGWGAAPIVFFPPLGGGWGGGGGGGFGGGGGGFSGGGG